MTINRKICRRQFLRGAGGFSLGLPFLPSLVPGPAYGADPQIEMQKRFVAIGTNHGGIFESAMYPSDSLLTETQTLFPGHEVSRGTLVSTVSNGERRLSNILRASDTQFTESISGKMNVLRGIDIPFYIAHHTGGHLGNYARNDGNGEDGQQIQSQYMPTIDQLMAWSNNFYRDINNVSLRSMVTGTNSRYSYNWTSPSQRNGNVVAVEHRQDFYSLFEDVFKPADEPSETFSNSFIVDRVLENYQSLRNGNRRIGSQDLQRLDDHMERLFELQRRLSATQQSTALCANFSLEQNISWNDYHQVSEAYVDVVEAAFLCGSSSIAVLGMVEEYFSSTPDWHQSIAHRWQNAGPQAQLQDVNQKIFEHVFINLAARLDVEESPECTILDNTLMAWTQESGESTHDARSIPIITCGGAGGFLQTGQYCDYRNKTESGLLEVWGTTLGYTGLLYNQWLSTALQAMGLQESEWKNIANNGPTGYGLDNISASYAQAQVNGVKSNADQVLPFLSVPT